MTEKYENIWQDKNWTIQARALINGLKKFPEDSKIILVVRHSHRRSSSDPERLARMGLTRQGREIARIFGKLLPKERPIRLYHSIVGRCIQTAEGILKGFKEIGGKGELNGILEALYNIGDDGPYIIEKAVRHAGQEFLDNWSNGDYPPDKVHSLSKYSQDSATDIWGLLESAPKGGIDIHVSHDLSIMGFRLGWFGLPAEDWWVTYMGGFALTFQNGSILLLDKGKIKKIDIPNWWSFKSTKKA